jgi:hypothetical protein
MRPWLLAIALASCTFDAGFVGGDGSADDADLDDGSTIDGDGAGPGDGVADGPLARFCDPGDPDLLLCLDFEGNLDDESSHDWTLEATGVTYVAGPPGRGMAARLDLGSLVRILDDPGWAPSEERTWEIWMNPDFVPVGSGRFGILDKEGEFSSFLNRDGVSCSAYGVGSVVTAAVAGAWHRVRCVYQTSGMSVYVDGTYQGAQIVTTTTMDAGNPLHIGSNGTDGADAWRGAIDGLRIWNAARAP